MNESRPAYVPPAPGTVEEEFGIPIPGVVLPPERWAKTALKTLPPAGPLDFAQLFGRTAPLVVELGCGNGRYTLLSALARPECDHFASDLLPAVIRYATRRANHRGLTNVRFAVKDAQTIVKEYLGEGAAAEIHLYHPQPFHDPREMNRRLLTPAFLSAVHRALRPGGLFVVQTDNAEYWQYMRYVLPNFFDWHEQNEPWPDAPEGRSRREILARSRGLPVYRGWGTRLELSVAERDERAAGLPLPTFRTRPAKFDLDALESDGEGGAGERPRTDARRKRGGRWRKDGGAKQDDRSAGGKAYKGGVWRGGGRSQQERPQNRRKARPDNGPREPGSQ